jgi:hypothetical protein
MVSDNKRERPVSQLPKDELSGFEELLERVPQSRIYEDDTATDQYYLTNFLFQEVDRLVVLDSFISEKLPTIEQYSETNYLVRQQQMINKEVKEELVAQMISLDSSIHGYMDMIWKQG